MKNTNLPSVLSSPDGQTAALFYADGRSFGDSIPPLAEALIQYGQSLQKIVIGDRDKVVTLEPEALKYLETKLKKMSKLAFIHLWGIKGLSKLKPPQDCEYLDCRRCPDLERVEDVMETVFTLVMDDCPKLSVLTLDESVEQDSERFESNANECSEIYDLSLQRSTALPTETINKWLQVAPKLKLLNLNGCSQLKRIEQWPSGGCLTRVSLNRCELLETLPELSKHERLYRLDLYGLKKLKRLHELPETVGYLDLRFTLNLQSLPESVKDNVPLTTYLFGSGVRMPPASIHGSHNEENVAPMIETYFRDLETVGKGSIKKCKLLLLGNGAAGKTTLARALEREFGQRLKKPGPWPDPSQTESEVGSTHGIRFQNLDFKDADDAERSLHVWDFGGQELYHNIHKQFIRSGSIFLLVWRHDQELGAAAPNHQGNEKAYEDTLLPLRYWVNLIKSDNPHPPRIGIVVSLRDAKEYAPEAKARIEKKLYARLGPDKPDNLSVHYVDAHLLEGDAALEPARKAFAGLADWIQAEASSLIEREGAGVPAHWQLAQEMVHSWYLSGEAEAALPEESEGHSTLPDKAVLSADVFRRELAEYCTQHAVSKLKRALKDGEFYPANLDGLTGDDESMLKVHQNRQTCVLEFLNRSGWILWDGGRLADEIVIDQRWYLRAVYTLLERREKEGEGIFEFLKSQQGRFAEEDLNGRGDWDSYSKEQRSRILSIMESIGVIFRLLDGKHAYSGRTLYASFRHLPTAAELNFQNRLDAVGDLNYYEKAHKVPFFHQAQWQELIIALGRQYGTNAEYALDGFYIKSSDDKTKEVHRILITSEYGQWVDDTAEDFAQGQVIIQVKGSKAEERGEEVLKLIEGAFKTEYGVNTGTMPTAEKSNQEAKHIEGSEGAFGLASIRSVFLSYAWNRRGDESPKIPEALQNWLIEKDLIKDPPLKAVEWTDADRAMQKILLGDALPDGENLKLLRAWIEKRLQNDSDIEAPVDWLHLNLLLNARDTNTTLTVDRDKKEAKKDPSYQINTFLDKATKADSFIAFTSGKYWQSDYCQFELSAFEKVAAGTEKIEKLIAVAICDTQWMDHLGDLRDYWSIWLKSGGEAKRHIRAKHGTSDVFVDRVRACLSDLANQEQNAFFDKWWSRCPDEREALLISIIHKLFPNDVPTPKQ